MGQLHFIDFLVLGFYLFTLIWIGFKNKESSNVPTDFILGGRKLSYGSFVATLVTTWYGAILGIGENTYLYGIQTWFIFSFPYYIFAFSYAIYIAPNINKTGLISIPDHFFNNYGKKSGVLSAILIIFLTSPAPYILSLGILLQFIFNIGLEVSLILSTLFSIIYIWNSGFKAVVKTDLLQFILMFLSFIILIGFLWQSLGDPIQMIRGLPEKFLDPLGGNSAQYFFVWFFIAAWTFIDPGFYQRSAAAETPEVARKGILTAIIFWAIFDTLTIFCGLYAINQLNIENALFTFPTLAIDFLPIGFFGLFITGIIAIIMSTIDSLSFISALTIGRDIFWKISPNSDNKKNIVYYIRFGLIISAIISLSLAYILPSVVGLLFTLGSVIIPSLILPFLATLIFPEKKVSDSFAIKWIFFPLFISILWLYLSKINFEFFQQIEPFYPGMFISLIFFLFLKVRNGN